MRADIAVLGLTGFTVVFDRMLFTPSGYPYVQSVRRAVPSPRQSRNEPTGPLDRRRRSVILLLPSAESLCPHRRHRLPQQWIPGQSDHNEGRFPPAASALPRGARSVCLGRVASPIRVGYRLGSMSICSQWRQVYLWVVYNDRGSRFTDIAHL